MITEDDRKWLSSLGRAAMTECNVLRHDPPGITSRTLIDRLDLVYFVARARHADGVAESARSIANDLDGCGCYADMCARDIPERIAKLARGDFR